MKNSNVKEIVMPGAILFLIVFVSVAVLAWCNSATYDKIQAINAENTQKARQNVLSDAKEFEEVSSFKADGIVKNVYKGTDGGKCVGYCVSVAPSGYGGEMEIMVGVDNDLKLTGSDIVSSSETAGLGKNASKESFRSQFEGLGKTVTVKKSAPKKENNEIQALSGATITSNAVADGANAAIEAVEKIKEAE